MYGDSTISLPNLESLALDGGGQPKLPPLEVEEKQDGISLITLQSDATIIWKYQENDTWKIYTQPLPRHTAFIAKTIRIGYEDSPELMYRPD